MWLFKVIDFVFFGFALGFLALLAGLLALVMSNKMRPPKPIVVHSKTMHTVGRPDDEEIANAKAEAQQQPQASKDEIERLVQQSEPVRKLF